VSARPAVRLRQGWLAITGTGAAASLALALLMLGCVFVAVGGARASQAVPTKALRSSVRKLTPLNQAVLGTSNYDSDGVGPLPLDLLSSYRNEIRSHLAADNVPLARRPADWSGLTTGYSEIFQGARKGYDGDTLPQLELVFRDSLTSYAKVVAGSLPERPSTSGYKPLPVTVTVATARRFGLSVGSRMRIDPGVELRVGAIIAPRHLGSAFWTVDAAGVTPTHTIPQGGIPYWQGAAFVTAAELKFVEQHTDDSAINLSWGFPMALHDLTAAQGSALRGQLSAGVLSRAGQVSVSPPVQVALSASVPSGPRSAPCWT
jgi:hypothetical protein